MESSSTAQLPKEALQRAQKESKGNLETQRVCVTSEEQPQVRHLQGATKTDKGDDQCHTKQFNDTTQLRCLWVPEFKGTKDRR